MGESTFQQLAENAALLLALAFVFDLVAARWRLGKLSLWQALVGLIIGLIGIGGMLNPWQFAPGIVFDTRSVLLSISGLFFGAVPTLVAMAITAAFRFFEGGSGAWTGVGVILATGTLGIAWRHLRSRPLVEMTWVELFLFGVAAHLVMLALMLTLPWAVALRVLAAISLPVLTVYPLATALLGALMVDRLRREQIVVAQSESETRFREISSAITDIAYSCRQQPAGGFAIFWITGATERITGYTIAEIMAFGCWGELVVEEDRPSFEKYVTGLAPGATGECELRLRRRDGGVVWVASYARCTAAPDNSGRAQLYGALADITVRKQAEARAQTAQAELERLLAEADQARRALLSVVEDQKAAEQSLQHRNALLAALQATTVELVSQLDLNILFENIVRRAGQLAGTSAGFLDLVNPSTGQLEPRVGKGALAESLEYVVQPGEGLAGAVWQTGRPVVVDDYDRWPHRIGGFSRQSLSAIVGVPLLSGEQVLGVLGLAHEFATPRPFDQETIDLLMQFARLAAIAIENARLFETNDRSRRALLSMVEDQKRTEEALRESNRRLSALNRVGLALAETLDLPAIYRTAYEHVSQLMDAPCFNISLYDAATHTLRTGYLFSNGELLDATRLPPLVIEESQPLRGRARAIEARQPEIVTDPAILSSETTVVAGRADDERMPHTALYVPITARGETIGLLETLSYRDHAYGAAEIELLQPVANQIGLAIENARLFNELQAEHDSLAQRVRDRTAELEAANQELEAFAYSVSHDLRAPLRALDGFSAALLASHAGRLDEQGQHYLDRIQNASQRMGQLINDLLDLSRITRREMHRREVDLSALASEIAAELQARAPQRQADFIIAEHLVVQGDSHLLHIALQNLLENAWKFTGPRDQARIEVGRISDFGSQISDINAAGKSEIQNLKSEVYFVRDNGVGFDMAYADKLFAPFQRLHAVHEFSGTGIGLATVQRIVVRHGGHLWAEAEVEKGATFFFTISDL